MGIGFALGGIAKGITDQQELGQRRQALALQTAEMQNNNAYRNASLGLEKQRLQQSASLEARSQAAQVFTGLMENIKSIVKEAQGQGLPQDKVAQAVATQLAEMKSLAPVLSVNPNTIDAEVNGLVSGTGGQPSVKVGQAWEKVQQKIANGEALTPGEETLKQLKISEMKALLGSDSGGDLPPDQSGAAPASAPTPTTLPAPTTSASAAGTDTTVPPIPKSLVGKNPGWDYKSQRWYLPNGSSYNRQGVPQ